MASVSASQIPADGGAMPAGDLVKSVGRFSRAMGLFGARQATRFFSAPGAQAAASFDAVTGAAGGQLTGLVRTAFAVGTNLQSGLIDAAYDAAGIGPRGQAPGDATTHLSMSLARSTARRLSGVRTLVNGALDRPVSQAEFIRRLSEHRTEATARGLDRARTAAGLWKSEGLATTIARHRLPGNSLDDPALPREVLPVTHVGFGAGSAESLKFDAAKLNAVFATVCASDYREFSYEGVGAMLRLSERGFFKLLGGTLGFIGLDTPDGPNPAGFFADYLDRFPPGIQRVIAHGYGRSSAFSHLSIYDAIAEATTLPPERVEPVVNGAAFAFGLMNSADLPHILRHSAVPFDRAVRSAFQNGLIYTLVFMEWYMPGLLAHWRPEGVVETELVEHARQENALGLRRGFPLAARLEHPRS